LPIDPDVSVLFKQHQRRHNSVDALENTLMGTKAIPNREEQGSLAVNPGYDSFRLSALRVTVY
jgi:hypothetical protein